MSVATVAITGEFYAATHMHDVLVECGLHPHPLQPNMQITHSGGEMGYSIVVPVDEAERAAQAIADVGLGKWLV